MADCLHHLIHSDLLKKNSAVCEIHRCPLIVVGPSPRSSAVAQGCYDSAVNGIGAILPMEPGCCRPLLPDLLLRCFAISFDTIENMMATVIV